MHAARELLFALLFVTLAWWQWQGRYAWLIAALAGTELCVTTRAAVVGRNTRVWSVSEQLSHVFLHINMGILLSLLYGELLRWGRLPDAVVGIDYGWRSCLLTALYTLAALWSVRGAGDRPPRPPSCNGRGRSKTAYASGFPLFALLGDPAVDLGFQ